MDLETWEYMKREQIAALTMAAMMVERSKDLEQAGRHVRGLLQICEAQIPPMGLKKSADTDNLSPAEVRRRANSSWEPGY
jgi:hypothetical protein